MARTVAFSLPLATMLDLTGHWPRGDAWTVGEAAELMMAGIDADLLEMLVCPASHAPLRQVGDWLYSTDADTRRKYAIRDGIPIMLIEESKEATPEEFQRVMAESKTDERSENQTKE